MSDTDFVPKESNLLYKNLRKFVRAFKYSRRSQSDQTRVRVELWLRLSQFREHLDAGIKAMEAQLFKEMDGRATYKFETRNRRVRKRIDGEGNQTLEIAVLHKKGEELDLTQGKTFVDEIEEDENTTPEGE